MNGGPSLGGGGSKSARPSASVGRETLARVGEGPPCCACAELVTSAVAAPAAAPFRKSRRAVESARESSSFATSISPFKVRSGCGVTRRVKTDRSRYAGSYRKTASTAGGCVGGGCCSSSSNGERSARHAHAVAACSFGLEQCLIGTAEQLVDRQMLVRRANRESYAHAHR